VSGEGARWDVPIHVISKRRDIVEALEPAGFEPGFEPTGRAIGPMASLADLLLDDFEGNGGAVSGEQSVVSGQRSAVSRQQSAVSRPPSAISNQQSAVSDQPLAISGQHSAGSTRYTAVSTRRPANGLNA
jgi:hypothetical protein